MVVNEITINGVSAYFQNGHTQEEWEAKYENDSEIWDIDINDFMEGAVELAPNMVYWYINGRMYETDIYVNE